MTGRGDACNQAALLYVIGFPKSGNTWLARLLADITASKIEANGPSDIVNAADNQPDRAGEYLIRKVHDVRDIDLLGNMKFVYVVRDVRDVLVSAFFHCNRWADDMDFSSSWVLRSYFRHEVLGLNKRWRGNVYDRCIATLSGIGGRRRQMIGSWSEHVERWTGMSGAVVVRYEDLLENTESVFGKLLEDLEIPASDSLVKAVVARQSFEARKRGFDRVGDLVNSKFMRSGVIGDWENFLSPKVLTRIEKRHGRVMNKMGYRLHSTELESIS